MAAILRSLVFYGAYYGGSFLLVLLALPVSLVNNRWAFPIIGLWARLHRVCVTGLLGIRVEQRGPWPSEAVLVAMKHESFFDALELPGLFPRPVVFAKAELLRIPVWGWLGGVHGLIPVEREAGAKALRTMLSGAKKQLGTGRIFVIFPEGTRVPHGQQPPLQAGFAALYKALNLPVVPIAVDSGQLYHRRWKQPGTITYEVGETIPPGLPRAEVEARVHQAINALNP